MSKKLKKTGGLVVAIMALLMFSVPAITQADLPYGFGKLEGITPTVGEFTLRAKAGDISVPDGGIIPMWGYSDGTNVMQYPAPTLIINEGDTITVSLINELLVNTSIVFPGHVVTTSGGTQGLLTAEAAPGGGEVAYTFTATNPGTYTYYSGTNMDLQIEMGMVGVIVVRPSDYAWGTDASHPFRTAYGVGTGSDYDVEYIEMFDDLDPTIHDAVAAGSAYNTNTNVPVYWSFNGRMFPDTIDHDLAGATQEVPWLPSQPYNALVVAITGQKVLVRALAQGNDFHPQHYHGNNGTIIARDGRMLETAPGGDKLFEDMNTNVTTPGQTTDMLWTWTGQEMDWDFYGHDLSDSINNKEVLAYTTLDGTIAAGATSLSIDGWVAAPWESSILADDGVVPSTHKINAIIYNFTKLYPHEDPDAEMVTLEWNVTSLNYDVVRDSEGTTPAKVWDDGSKIAYTEHGRPFPVILPELQDLSFGAVYHGSPFMGNPGNLPPGEGGLNPFNAFAHPWHVHHEKNLANDDVFIGGQLTVIFLLPNGPVPVAP